MKKVSLFLSLCMLFLAAPFSHAGERFAACLIFTQQPPATQPLERSTIATTDTVPSSTSTRLPEGPSTAPVPAASIAERLKQAAKNLFA